MDTEINYDSDKRLITCVTKEKRNFETKYEVTYIFLTPQENIIFKDLYYNETIKVEDYSYLLEEKAFVTAICRLRQKVKNIYKIRKIRKICYMLIRR